MVLSKEKRLRARNLVKQGMRGAGVDYFMIDDSRIELETSSMKENFHFNENRDYGSIKESSILKEPAFQIVNGVIESYKGQRIFGEMFEFKDWDLATIIVK